MPRDSGTLEHGSNITWWPGVTMIIINSWKYVNIFAQRIFLLRFCHLCRCSSWIYQDIFAQRIFFWNFVTSVVADRGYMRIYFYQTWIYENVYFYQIKDIWEYIFIKSWMYKNIYSSNLGSMRIYLHRGRAEPRDPDQEITKSERLHW